MVQLILHKNTVLLDSFQFQPSRTPTHHPKISNSLVSIKVRHPCGTLFTAMRMRISNNLLNKKDPFQQCEIKKVQS